VIRRVSAGWIAALLLCLAGLLSDGAAAAEPTLPALTGRVVDEAGILSAPVRARLTDALAAHEAQTSNQVAVATLRSLQGYEIEDFSVRLFRAWRLGQQKNNNGVLLVVAPNERRVRIEVGYGLEGALPDATAHSIIQTEILPRFRVGDVEDGVVRGTTAILGAIAGTYKPKSGKSSDPHYDTLMIIIFGAFIMMMLYNSYYAYRFPHRRNPWNTSGGFGGGGFGGGGFGGRSSSGGGFSGGGGSSGGGGASGRW
jgi:uncharacterized protein